MDTSKQFKFEKSFAKSAPEARSYGVEANGEVARRGKYDFAVAYPDPVSLPLKELVNSLSDGLSEEGEDLAIYPHPQGYPPLRELISDRLSRTRGVEATPESIMLGDGSGQPIHLILEALLDPGDVVFTEDFTYSGTLNALRRFRAEIVGIQCDQSGFIPDVLEHTIRTVIESGRKPKLIYTIPTFQNPQGWTASLERRMALVHIAQSYGIPVIEDDCYVDLRYEGKSVTTLHSMDESGLVMYVGSFSKIIAPGMRMGFLVAPEEILARVRGIKSGGGVNQFAALAVHRFAKNKLDKHVHHINELLRSKRDAMLAALGENFGSAADWSEPEGGLYVWVRVKDERADLEELRSKALMAEVGYQCGVIYSPDGTSGKNFARLCFGYNSPEEIHEGIARLAEVFETNGVLNV